MATTTLVPVETYLRSSYRPDRDYIDGELLERNVGEIPHGRLQGYFIKLFARHEIEWGLEAIPETRLQVASTRFRIPDVTVLPLDAPDTLIIHSTPVLCIEIFSSEDRMSRMQERVADYKRMGVPAVWVIDPWRRLAYMADAEGKLETENKILTVPDSPVTVAVEEIFAELDRLAQRASV